MAATTEMALEGLTEQAVIAWVGSTVHGISLGITPRQEQTDDATSNLTLPAVIIKAVRDHEEPFSLTGVWRMRVMVDLLVNADDTTSAGKDTYWHNLMSILVRDDLASQLSAQKSNFYCYGVLYDGPTDQSEEDRHWRNSLTFSAWCMPMDLS